MATPTMAVAEPLANAHRQGHPLVSLQPMSYNAPSAIAAITMSLYRNGPVLTTPLAPVCQCQTIVTLPMRDYKELPSPQGRFASHASQFPGHGNAPNDCHGRAKTKPSLAVPKTSRGKTGTRLAITELLPCPRRPSRSPLAHLDIAKPLPRQL